MSDLNDLDEDVLCEVVDRYVNDYLMGDVTSPPAKEMDSITWTLSNKVGSLSDFVYGIIWSEILPGGGGDFDIEGVRCDLECIADEVLEEQEQDIKETPM